MKEKKKPLNDEIQASRVQLITDDGENLWEMTIEEARTKARELELDLMEIGTKWDLGIVKLLDYWKFLYRQKKQEQKNKQKWRAPEIKTLRITFKIWEHDLEVRKNQAEKFAQNGHPLKVTLMLRWRENQYEDIASDKMKYFAEYISEFYKLDWGIKKAWNTFIAQFKPTK